MMRWPSAVSSQIPEADLIAVRHGVESDWWRKCRASSSRSTRAAAPTWRACQSFRRAERLTSPSPEKSLGVFLLGGRAIGEVLAQARRLERPGLLEDRIGDRADVRVDALEVVDDVEVQRTGLDRLHGLPGKAAQMRVRVLLLELAQLHLGGEQALRAAQVDVQEHIHV